MHLPKITNDIEIPWPVALILLIVFLPVIILVAIWFNLRAFFSTPGDTYKDEGDITFNFWQYDVTKGIPAEFVESLEHRGWRVSSDRLDDDKGGPAIAIYAKRAIMDVGNNEIDSVNAEMENLAKRHSLEYDSFDTL